jgi:transcription termination factor NusB
MMMTKNEARDILNLHNLWRRGKAENMPDAKELGVAIDAAIAALKRTDDLVVVYMEGFFNGKRSKSSIAQAIRDAAVNWPPQHLGNVECQIIDAFTSTYEHARWRPNSVMFAESVTKARTFMLLVEEALES